MGVTEKAVKLTPQQQRVVKLLFKFRFVSAQALSLVMGIRRISAYEVLETLVSKDLVTKVYTATYRIDRKPAYYYLNKAGVTNVRKLMDVKASVVHALYKNDTATDAFIARCLLVAQLYPLLKTSLPSDTDMFTKTEINRFQQFPKTRPDLYIRTPARQEAMLICATDLPFFIIRKRLVELLTHMEDEGWHGPYPRLAFVLPDERTKSRCLAHAATTLDSMGIDSDELTIIATTLPALVSAQPQPWSSVYAREAATTLFG